ncbi:MAG: ASKHA domain-containing protein, partial [Opitutales bacterium]
PAFIEGRRVTASSLGLSVGEGAEVLAPETPLQLLPGIAAYVGADITAGLYATGMIFDEAPALFVDIGTNGEIVLQNDGRLVACATAAGPAFEGSGLQCGARAHEGAISDIKLSLDPFSIEVETIGDVPTARADGICGSAYIDFIAEGKRAGLLLENGRFAPEAWARIPQDLRVENTFGHAVRVAGPAGPYIGESDIAVLLQAKAAIAAGIETLLDASGLEMTGLSRVYLAGGFGMHLNMENAISSGLLPGFREDQVSVVGNTSLAGGLLALLDRTTLDEMETLRSRVSVLELNLQEGFEDRFVDHMTLYE